MASVPYSLPGGPAGRAVFSAVSRGDLACFSEGFSELRQRQDIAERRPPSNVESGPQAAGTAQETSGETAPAATLKKSVSGPAAGSISRRSVEVRKACAGRLAT